MEQKLYVIKTPKSVNAKKILKEKKMKRSAMKKM